MNRKGIRQGADDAGGHDREDLAAIRLSIGITFLDDTAGKVGDGPEQEQDGQAAGDGAHEVDAMGGGMRVVAEQDDKETAQQDEQGGSGGVRDLQFDNSWR